MATTANETLKKQFELLQQQQLVKLERRRKLKDEKEEKLKGDNATYAAAANGSFGVEDDLGLKLSEAPPASSGTVSDELAEHLNDQLRELKDENGRLYKLLSERDFEIKQLKKKREDDQLALAGSLGMGSDTAATKIVELSKKVRELTALLEAKKTEAKQLASKCMSLEYQIESANVQAGSPRYLAQAPAGDGIVDQKLTESDYRALQEKHKQTELKVAEYRNQVQSLRQELKVAQKVIANEVGDGVTVQELLSSSGGNWRGRAQQVLALQKKINELKAQLEQTSAVAQETGLRSGRSSDFDLEAEFMGTSVSRQRADDRHREALRKLERERKEALEKAASELKALEEDHAALKQKFDASKARNKTLSEEVKLCRDQVKRLEEKGKHDNELVDALIAREVQMKQMIEDITKLQQTSQDKQTHKLSELSLKAQHDTNTVDRLKVIVEEKEYKIQELLKEVSLLRHEHPHDGRSRCSPLTVVDKTVSSPQAVPDYQVAPSASSRHGSASIGPRSSSSLAGPDRPPSRRTPLPASAQQSGPIGEREADLQQYKSLAQAAEVERDKLMELVSVTQKRLDEANEAATHAQSELKQHKQRCVQLEKQLGRIKMGTSTQRKTQTSDKGKTKTAGFDGIDNPFSRNEEVVAGAIDELETMLAIQRDENEAIKAALQSTLEAKENDLKLYNEMLSETKAVFLQGLKQLKQQLHQQH